MGVFGPGYVRHQYREWLLRTVADLLDDDPAISSAGLLRGGAVAWVEVSMPDTITTPEGVAFRPNLLATNHEGLVRGDRAERNNLKTINGDYATRPPHLADPPTAAACGLSAMALLRSDGAGGGPSAAFRRSRPEAARWRRGASTA
jgi:hypothetical protein